MTEGGQRVWVCAVRQAILGVCVKSLRAVLCKNACSQEINKFRHDNDSTGDIGLVTHLGFLILICPPALCFPASAAPSAMTRPLCVLLLLATVVAATATTDKVRAACLGRRPLSVCSQAPTRQGEID